MRVTRTDLVVRQRLAEGNWIGGAFHSPHTQCENCRSNLEREADMALVKCEECGNEVSNRATACPKCGAPIAHAVMPPAGAAPAGKPAVPIEQTGKRYKGQMLAAGALACVGAVVAASFSPAIGVLMVLGGGVWLLAARFGAWWHHG
jgi:ribosomal protein L32